VCGRPVGGFDFDAAPGGKRREGGREEGEEGILSLATIRRGGV